MEGSLFLVYSFILSFTCSFNFSSSASVLAKKSLMLGRKQVGVGESSNDSFLGKQSIPNSSHCSAPTRPSSLNQPVPYL